MTLRQLTSAASWGFPQSTEARLRRILTSPMTTQASSGSKHLPRFGEIRVGKTSKERGR